MRANTTPEIASASQSTYEWPMLRRCWSGRHNRVFGSHTTGSPRATTGLRSCDSLVDAFEHGGIQLLDDIKGAEVLLDLCDLACARDDR
jgi:hypothetical protein